MEAWSEEEDVDDSGSDDEYQDAASCESKEESKEEDDGDIVDGGVQNADELNVPALPPLEDRNEFLPDGTVGDESNQVGDDVEDNIDEDNQLSDVATPNETPNKKGSNQGNVQNYLIKIGSSSNDVFSLQDDGQRKVNRKTPPEKKAPKIKKRTNCSRANVGLSIEKLCEQIGKTSEEFSRPWQI